MTLLPLVLSSGRDKGNVKSKVQTFILPLGAEWRELCEVIHYQDVIRLFIKKRKKKLTNKRKEGIKLHNYPFSVFMTTMSYFPSQLKTILIGVRGLAGSNFLNVDWLLSLTSDQIKYIYIYISFLIYCFLTDSDQAPILNQN